MSKVLWVPMDFDIGSLLLAQEIVSSHSHLDLHFSLQWACSELMPSSLRVDWLLSSPRQLN